MKSISVKVNDSVQTIAQTKVVTKDSQPTVIKATRNANYELINDATGYAPDHIVTKRVGKDLHISFEDDAKESDLIIKDFYDYDKSALIGQAESGQYHYYVPDTGLTQDYVTELVIGDIEGQALGGQGYPAPWWIGAEEGSRFGVMPWLVGIAGLAGIAAVVSGRDDKGNDNNNNANASAQEKPLNIENIQSDTVAQGATQALNFTVTSNGQNVSQAIISVNGTELKDANNKTVLTDKDGKVNITAQLLKANGIKLGELLDFTISAEEEHYTQATATLHNPGVVKMDGGVVVTPHESATELEVTYTKPDQTISTAKFTKNTNGDGKAGAWIDNNKDDSVTIDPATGKVVIPVNTIGSNTNVTAKQTTDVGTTNNSKGVSDILSAKPVVEAIKTGDNAGNVVIKPSDDAINGSKVVVSYTDADGKSNTATIAKDKGAWTADASLPKGVSLDKDKGTVTISSDNVTDGSDVSATQTDPGREESVPASDRAKTSVPQPKINANDDGSVTVTPSDKANKVTINYTDEDGKQNTATIAKDNNGKWTSNDNKVVIGNDGSITIPADRVKDGSTATAEQTVGTKDSGKVPVVVNNQNGTTPAKPASPEINANDDGSVTVTPSDKANKVTINYTDEDGKQNTATIAKDNNGKWTSNDNKVVIGNDGSITIPADKVKDGSKVTAQQTTSVGISNPANTTAKDSIAEPEVTANNNGSVTVKPAKDATKVEISYVDEDNKEQTVTANKDNNGKWTSNNDKVVISNDGTITIPADKVKDGSDVTANQTTNNGKSGDSSATVADAPSNTLKPQTGADNITITVAGDDIVNKAEADQTTVPVVVKVAPQNGETVTGVKVTVKGKEHTATKDANGDYVAQVPSADIKTDTAKTATAKVTLSKADKTGTVTDTENYTVDIDAPTVKGTRQDDGSVTGTTDPNTAITDKAGKPITDADGKPIVSDAKGVFTIPAGKVPTDNTIGAKDPAGNVGTGNVKPADNTLKPQTGADNITITVAGDDIVNKAEADQTTVPVVVKVAPQNGETVTGVKVTVKGKEHTATKDANGDYVAQVPSADIKTDTAKTATAKVTLSKADKTGTVTDTENYTVDIDAPAKPTTPDMTAQTDTGVSNKDDNTSNNKPSFTVQTPADGETPVLMVDGNPVEAEVTKNNGTTTLTPKQSIPDGDHEVSVAVTDSAGNTSKSSELPITIDTEAPTKPKVTIGKNEDGKITDDELDANGNVTITVGLPGDAKAGDTVVINDDDKGIELTDDHIKAGKVEVKVKAPGDGIDLAAKNVFIKDKAGNRSESDSETAQREVAKPNAPTIELVKDTTRKGFPDGGKDFVTKTNGVKISSDAKDATIEYRLNGGEWKTYDGKPITLPENNKSKGVTTKIETKQTVNGKESEVHEQSITIDKKAGLSAGIEKGGDGNYYITGIAEKGSVLKFSGQNVNGKTLTVTNDDGSFRLPIGKNLTTNVARTIQVTDKAGNESSVHFTSHEYGNINTTGISGAKPAAVNAATSGKNDYILIGSGGGYGDISSSLVWANDKVNTQGGDDTIVAYSKITSVTGKVEVDMGAGNDTLRVGNNVYGNSNTSTKILMGDGDDNVVIGDTALQANPHTERGNSISGGVFDLGRGDDTMSVYAGISSGARINGGAGFDTFNFTGKGVNQDLGVMTGMEVINLTGTGGNTLNVKISDVLNNADTATTINGQSYQGLFINGNNQDKVDLGANGTPRRGDKLGGFVKDIREGTAPEGYDAYWDGSNENTYVFIQKGIEVI